MGTHACAIVHALHEYVNLRYVLACARQFDDVEIAREQYKRSLRAFLTRDESALDTWRSRRVCIYDTVSHVFTF